MNREALRVAVVGGGILGVSTGVHLARAGAEVTLITEGDLCSGSTGRSLSWINSFYPCSESYHLLRVLGMRRYRDYLRRPGASEYVQFHGGLQWYQPQNTERLWQAFEHLERSGYKAEWLRSEEVSSRAPGVAAEVLPERAVFAADEGWVDLPRLVDTLAAEAVAAGAKVITGAGPAHIGVTGDRVTSVTSSDGIAVEVDAAVLATGVAVPSAVKELGISIPDASGRCLLVQTEPVEHPLAVVVNSPAISLRRTPDGGFAMDSAASAAASTEDERGRLTVPPEVVDDLVLHARTLLEGNPPLTVDRVFPGRKPIPGGDGHPVVGAIPAVKGYYVAFTHSGATLGLVLGEMLADEIVTGTPNPILESFRPARFR